MFLRPISRLVRTYFQNRKEVRAAIAAGMLVIAMNTAVPLIVGQTVDAAVAGHRNFILPLVGALLFASFLKAIGVRLRKLRAGEAAIQTEARLRAQLYEHLQALDLRYHERVPTGQSMSRASSDLNATRDFLSILPLTVSLAVFVVLVTVVLLFIDVPLGLVTLAGMPVMGSVAARLTRKLHPEVLETQRSVASLTSVAEETVTGIRVVKAFGREPAQVAKLESEAVTVMRHALGQIRIRAVLNPIFELFPALSLALVLWFGGHRLAAGHIGFDTFVAFLMFITQIQWPVRLIGWIASDGQQAATASSRIFEVLDTRPGIEDRPGARPISIERGSLRFENITYRYESGRPVLDGVQFEVPQGGSLALVGPTGCGKTTVLKLILRFLEPTAGRVLIDDVDISEVTLESLRNRIGTVFEDTFLFSDTVANNIAFARPGAPEDEIISAAVLAQAHKFIGNLPNGYASVVGEQGYTLSGGQRQRVAIARAILMDPRILLLDDATSAVDPRVGSLIKRGLKEAMTGRSTIMVARRPGSAAMADRVIHLEAGRIAAVGTHEELWTRSRRYREVLVGDATQTQLPPEVAAR